MANGSSFWLSLAQAEFLLKPRTPDELLAFCRRNLGLRFPTDPSPDHTDVTGGAEKRQSCRNTFNLDHAARASGSGGGGIGAGADSGGAGGGRVSGTSGGGSSGGGSGGGGGGVSNSSSSGSLARTKKLVDRLAVASDLARAVLAWGPPFREIRTAWRAAAAGQSYAVASQFSRPLPRVTTLVLCSAPDVLKGTPTPLLRPGTFGEPFSTDVTVEDVRWLQDQWEAT